MLCSASGGIMSKGGRVIFCWRHGSLNGSAGQCAIFHHPVKSQRLLGGLNLVHIFMSPGGWSLRTLVNPCGFSLWKLNYLEAKTYCTWCTRSCFCKMKQSINEMGGKKKIHRQRLCFPIWWCLPLENMSNVFHRENWSFIYNSGNSKASTHSFFFFSQ